MWWQIKSQHLRQAQSVTSWQTYCLKPVHVITVIMSCDRLSHSTITHLFSRYVCWISRFIDRLFSKQNRLRAVCIWLNEWVENWTEVLVSLCSVEEGRKRWFHAFVIRRDLCCTLRAEVGVIFESSSGQVRSGQVGLGTNKLNPAFPRVNNYWAWWRV